MAVILDERARAAVVRRRARGKDGTIYLRLERATVRTGIPCVVVVGWSPHHPPARELVVRRVGDVDVSMDWRVARFTQRRDMTVSAARLGPFEWLVVADPFAAEGLMEWERTHDLFPLPPEGLLATNRLEAVRLVRGWPEGSLGPGSPAQATSGPPPRSPGAPPSGPRPIALPRRQVCSSVAENVDDGRQD
ncbi:MAG: hypothetical protein JOZ41_10275 [Chloroflexi bacterium]|nr:hypothetical protein [Chloroflexota bacterium]